jgi:uncharacterized protein HemX
MPPATSQNPTSQTPQKEGAGPIVGAIIVLLLLILGGIYFWSERAKLRNSHEIVPYTAVGVSASVQ